MPGNGQASKYFWMKKRKSENGAANQTKTKIKARDDNNTSPSAQKSILSFFKKSKDSSDQEEVVVVTPEPKRRKVEVRNNKEDKLKEFVADSNNGTEENDDLPYPLPLPADLPVTDPTDKKEDDNPVDLLPSSSSKLTPLEQQVRDLKRRYPHLLLFVECGYRYRFFGRDAQIAAKVFDISCHPDRNFLVASVPTFNGPANYVRKLVQEGHKVGIVSQAETAAAKQASGQSSSGPFERKLSAVYTRTGFMGEDVGLSACEAMAGDPQGNVKSMVAAIDQDKEGRVAVMAVQPTTGEVLYADIEQDDAGKSELRRCLDFIQPLEVLLPKEGLAKVTEATIELCSSIGGQQYKIERVGTNLVCLEEDSAESAGLSDDSVLGQLMPALPPPLLSCLRVLIKYLKELGLAEALLKASNVTKLELGDEKMFLPDMTLRNLEVFQTLTPAPSNRGTLFHSMNRTVTRQGARLLKDWIGAPLRSHYEIRQRQNVIKFLLSPQGSLIRNDVKACLSKMLDLEVALTACLCEKIRPGDFARMCESMMKAKDMAAKVLSESQRDCPELLLNIFRECSSKFEPIGDYLKNMDRKAASDGKFESLFVDWSFSPPVLECADKIRDIEEDLKRHKGDIKRKLGLQSFEYACVSGLEYLVEVKQSRAAEAPDGWRRMSSTKQVVRFRTPFVLENLPRLVYQREQLGERCREAWAEFVREFNAGYHRLQSGARRVAELDCLISLAEVSAGEGFTCPDILEEKMVRDYLYLILYIDLIYNFNRRSTSPPAETSS